MELTVPRVILRLIAIAVLLSGIADYSAFDMRDPVAPMDVAGTSGFARNMVDRQLIPVMAQKTDGQDDGCICCAAGLTVHRVQLSTSEAVAAMYVLSIGPPAVPSLASVDPPPRA
jgi:hypothetical protein